MASNRKDPALDSQHQAILLRMQQLPENKRCADCHGPAPRWASTNLGCFLCISCSGIHRKLGVHISTIRSTTLDTWTPAQVEHFQELGNEKSRALYEANIPSSFRRPTSSDAINMERFIRDKYERLLFASEEVARHSAGSRPVTEASYREGRGSPNHGFERGSGATAGHLANHDSPDISHHMFVEHHGAHGSERGRLTTSGLGRRPAQSPAHSEISPYQRAETMKQILDMGFPPRVAARALEVSRGNLERAVDWVLQNEASVYEPPDNRFATAEQIAEVAAPRSSQPGPTHSDLLDFTTENPPLTYAKPGQEVRIHATKAGVDPPAWVASDEDFADFGAFESALPATAATKPTAGTTLIGAAPGRMDFTTTASTPVLANEGSKISGSSLASLYAKRSHAPPASGHEHTTTALAVNDGVKVETVLNPQGIADGGPVASFSNRNPSPTSSWATQGTMKPSMVSGNMQQPSVVSNRGSVVASGPRPTNEKKVAKEEVCAASSPLYPVQAAQMSSSPSSTKSPRGFVSSNAPEDPFASLASFALTESKARKPKPELLTTDSSVRNRNAQTAAHKSRPDPPGFPLDHASGISSVDSITANGSGHGQAQSNLKSQPEKPDLHQPDLFSLESSSRSSSTAPPPRTGKALSLDDLLGL
jgi:stromal membrane-associated protein